VTPLISAAYNVTFKLIDRGALEAFGSVSVSTHLQDSYYTIRRASESGFLYTYLTLQLVSLILLFIAIILF
jgi:hypothetical protein